jgi:hypothetical protein
MDNLLRSPWVLLPLAVLAAATAAGFLLVPMSAVLPIRWGLNLQVIETAPRNFALLQMPFAAALILVVVTLFRRFGNAERAARNAATLRYVMPLIAGLFAVIEIAMVWSGLPRS